jgi:hypothetical protein
VIYLGEEGTSVARFKVNRLSTLILTLGVSLLCCAMTHRTAMAAGSDPAGNTGVIGDPSAPGGGQNGDPDIPSGSGKRLPRGPVKRIGTGPVAGSVGDGLAARSVVMWRLRVVLESWRSFYLRY